MPSVRDTPTEEDVPSPTSKRRRVVQRARVAADALPLAPTVPGRVKNTHGVDAGDDVHRRHDQ
jgi:hypothetical protein